MQKREKDQVIITCSGFVEIMEGMIKLVLVCSSCTGHVGRDVNWMQVLCNMVENFGYGDGGDE